PFDVDGTLQPAVAVATSEARLAEKLTIPNVATEEREHTLVYNSTRIAHTEFRRSCKTPICNVLWVVTGAGIEPAARALKVRCSTTELPSLSTSKLQDADCQLQISMAD